jgi:hypothetical protein
MVVTVMTARGTPQDLIVKNATVVTIDVRMKILVSTVNVIL